MNNVNKVPEKTAYSAFDKTASERLRCFKLDGEPILCRKFGSGHINETYLVVDETARTYILQKINRNVFKDPYNVMCNVVAVTEHLKRTAETYRNVMEIVPASTGELWHVDSEGEYWRVYSYISDSVCFQRTQSESLFRESASAFGTFQNKLADFPADTLFESIPKFHDTTERYRQYHAALSADVYGRAAEAAREIEFALAHEALGGTLMARYAEGALPLRVTHNDTKLNNVLFDRRTLKSLCVIDLDTVMPGFSVTDFGDSIRYGATTAAEDERDLSKVQFSLKLFKAYAEGFLSACGSSLTTDEIDSLCDAALVITLEIGVRFLTDYLSGDVYFRTAYGSHNLDRSRTQFKLVECMEASWDSMQTAIKQIAKMIGIS